VGFEVDLAEDGAVGLDLYQTRDYYLVFLDLMMPRVNGYAFLERVNSAGPRNRKSHIIIFTAAGNRGIERVPEGAVCSAILKPFDLDQFLELVNRCLDGQHE
ncbi:MAG TPA: response regulator, partial [Thermoanaerobaculia bacterium]